MLIQKIGKADSRIVVKEVTSGFLIGYHPSLLFIFLSLFDYIITWSHWIYILFVL